MKYYNNIDLMPLYNWRKCNDGEQQYTRLDVTNGSESEDIKHWELIYDSYLKVFGLGKEYERVLEIKKEIALLQCDLVIEDNNFLINKIKRLQRQLEDIINKPVESNITTCIIHLSKWAGYRINEREVTVLEFYEMLKEYQKEIELTKKNGKQTD